MNVWDYIIIGILAGIVVLAVFLVRRRKSSGCCGSDSCQCGSCSGCSHSAHCETAKNGKTDRKRV